GQPAQRSYIRIVVKIARQNNRTGFRQIQEEHLMTGSVSWSGLENHRIVAENVIGVLVDDDRFAVGERTVVGGDRPARRWSGKHDVAFGFASKPGGTRKVIRMGGV